MVWTIHVKIAQANDVENSIIFSRSGPKINMPKRVLGT